MGEHLRSRPVTISVDGPRPNGNCVNSGEKTRLLKLPQAPVSLGCVPMMSVRRFHDEHASEIDASRPRTLDFRTGKGTERSCPVAKVVDMVFVQGRL